MVNFTGIMKIGEDYITTQSVNDWHDDKTRRNNDGIQEVQGVYLTCTKISRSRKNRL